MTSAQGEVQAAGVVAFRPGREVLLVHRPKYDDWSFPKGKLDRGEERCVAAVREAEEETGLTVRLTRPISAQRYPVVRGTKRVAYWTARVVGDDEVSTYSPNAEIDQVAWVRADKAAQLLTYSRDRATLEEAVALRKPTRALIVLRHAESRARRTWRGQDRARPLLAAGRRQAISAVEVLNSYGVGRVVTSSSTRCVESVAPYAAAAGLEIERTGLLSEEDAGRKSVTALMRWLTDTPTGDKQRPSTVLCSHRPVLPWIFKALGVPDPGLAKGELLVVHLRGDDVTATERVLTH
jgi:8-oxo-dGTP pyrophosphatase MutT (NUDIX family)/phosphohistidine phosphatase SixA